MELQNSFYTEYLSETSLVITQEDFGNELYDILSPIRSLLAKDREILSYSLARYAGANARLAFFCQWFFVSNSIFCGPDKLFTEDQEFLRKKVPTQLRGISNLYDLIDKDIDSIFLPTQIAFLSAKQNDLMSSLLLKYPFLGKYLNQMFLGEIKVSMLADQKFLYTPSFTLSTYLEKQYTGLSFLQIGLPCLLGFLFAFSQENSPVNPQKVKWVMLLEVLKGIAFLHQVNSSNKLDLFVYRESLSDKDRFNWLQKDYSKQLATVLTSKENKEKVNQIKQRVQAKTTSDLESLILPEKNLSMLRDLLEWTSYLTN